LSLSAQATTAMKKRTTGLGRSMVTARPSVVRVCFGEVSAGEPICAVKGKLRNHLLSMLL